MPTALCWRGSMRYECIATIMALQQIYDCSYFTNTARSLYHYRTLLVIRWYCQYPMEILSLNYGLTTGWLDGCGSPPGRVAPYSRKGNGYGDDDSDGDGDSVPLIHAPTHMSH
jgi:hypothetical protein